MRNEFLDVKSYKKAKELAPWAAVIVKVWGGGYRAFESVTDYEVWKNQR